MLKKYSSIIRQKDGMSLVELLTAMTILTLMIFCFAPLFLSYYTSIDFAGEKLQETYKASGMLQQVINNRKEDTSRYTGYFSGNFNNVMTIKSQDGSKQVSLNTSAKFLGNDPETLYNSKFKEGYVTIVSSYANSTIQCFPSTITDDFKEKFITIVNVNGSFDSHNYSSPNSYKISVTKSDGSLLTLTYGKEYTLTHYQGQNDMLLMTLRGGSNICFENSPLVFNYNNGEYEKEIQIDAPTAIMVGEQASDDEYYYYATRGHIDDDGNLEVIQKEMTGAPLTSAMNDVSWVSAESSDGYKDTDSAGNPTLTDKNKYGYYIMCGDNGEVRRFWRNEKTGNYYWGGDYTYDTTIITNEETGTNTYNTTLKKDTSVSYKYAYHDKYEQTDNSEGVGFVLTRWVDTGIGKDFAIAMVSCNVMSVTAMQDYSSNSNIQNLAKMYVSDGKVYYFRTHKEKNAGKRDSATISTNAGMLSAINANGIDDVSFEKLSTSENSTNLFFGMNQAVRWFNYNQNEIDKYYDWTGQNKATTNPITLTCAEGIQITKELKNSKGYYTTSADFGEKGGKISKSSYYSGSLEYPTSSYSLYCGYIPAVMDIWTTSSFRGDHWAHDTVMSEDKKYYAFGDTSLNNSSIIDKSADGKTTAYNSTSFANWSTWKGTFGIMPYGDINNIGTKKFLFTGWHKPLFQDRRYDTVVYYPYKNINYGVLGKFWDGTVNGAVWDGKAESIPSGISVSNLLNTYGLTVSSIGGKTDSGEKHNNTVTKQRYTTAGNVIDITVSYLSHPLALHRSLNPTDDLCYDMSNDRVDFVFLWSNSRDTATYLDIASTNIPNGDKDIPVTLMVGYTMGGLTEQEYSRDLYANTIMNNGLVLLRAGNVNADYPTALEEGLFGIGNDRNTDEEKATDHEGYKLDAESNVFHQFYYLNSRTTESDNDEPYRGALDNHIGDLYGANLWQNNRHIDYVSINGGAPDDPTKDNTGSYNYLRCHPLSNTKVNCVEWGVTWDDSPQAMWGTENGTLLSWDVNLDKVKNETDSNWNDRSVDAEFQSYRWILNVSGVGGNGETLGTGKTFAVGGKAAAGQDNFKERVGAHWGKKNDYVATTFVVGNNCPEPYYNYYDIWSTTNGIWRQAGFVSILESINDIEFADDIWVAVGDQSGQNPATFCPAGTTKGSATIKPYIDKEGDGKGGSWVNVRMWYDVKGNGKYAIYDGNGKITTQNTEYYWSAVQISTNANYNIQQINCINGIWMATGYIDGSNGGTLNDEYDDGEKTVVCWTRDPSIPCGMPGGWSEDVAFWKYTGEGNDGFKKLSTAEVGGINSVAARN